MRQLEKEYRLLSYTVACVHLYKSNGRLIMANTYVQDYIDNIYKLTSRVVSISSSAES